MAARQVFEGLKVADFTWVAAGPLVTLHLAAHGATVVKVESVSRPELLRTAPPFKDNVPGINRSAYFTEFNPSKLSISLDLAHPSQKGIEVARRLIAWADIVAENFAPGVMERWGLAYERVREINPRAIMLSLSFCGRDGPCCGAKGYGNQLAGLAGFTEITGWPDRRPVTPWGAYTDFIAPRIACAGVLAALIQRKRTGQGVYLDLAQYELGLEFLAPLLLDYNVNGRIAARNGNRSAYEAPNGVYPCLGDDRYCAISVTNDEEWKSLCQETGHQEWCEDPRFASFAARKAHEDELDALIGSWAAGYTAEEVMARLQSAGVPAGVVATTKEVHEDPQLAHRGHYQLLEHPEIGAHSYSSTAAKLSKVSSAYKTPAPLLGQHTEYVLRDLLGMSEDEYVELLVESVIEQCT